LIFYSSLQFDGKLVQYFNVKGARIGIGDLPHQRLVTISKLVTLPDLVARSERLDFALESGNIADFCQEKVSQVTPTIELFHFFHGKLRSWASTEKFCMW